MTTVVVVAKECLPGRVKTRLCPPLTRVHAALVAQAALDDTLTAVRGAGGTPLLYFDGARPPSSASGFDVLSQCCGPFDERLAHLFDVCVGPTVLIGMDTPQVDPALLRRLAAPWPDDVEAWFGEAADGGFWLLALREPTGAHVRGVEMSLDTTGAEVRSRLDEAGLRTCSVGELRDVDTVADAIDVAAAAPHTRFARQLRRSLADLGVTTVGPITAGVPS
ncbi:DUF2064 domain-containing protein [Terrabacter sp. Ter38]|uniref:TIGR04282 family arsenosugar biosynthesis glycosyltransferase n=1 Tax=Terrabacter sp. Ter38 TaxID=2926030 RepID=UPI002118112D|nr:DUF2064 domain-containing protein [Terrabacter sp. Ter38]